MPAYIHCPPPSAIHYQVKKPGYIVSKKIVKIADCQTLERSILEKVNQFRRTKGLGSLTLNEKMCQIARIHSQNMADKKVSVGHEGFKKRFIQMTKAVHCYAAGENVAYTYLYANPDEVAVDGWKKSPGHRKNMMGDYNLTGIGVRKDNQGKYYLTQLFAKTP